MCPKKDSVYYESIKEIETKINKIINQYVKLNKKIKSLYRNSILEILKGLDVKLEDNVSSKMVKELIDLKINKNETKE